MCFEFGCFGGSIREDYGGERSARKEPRGRGRRGNRGNGANYGGATDLKAPQEAAYHTEPHASMVEEAGHKAYHDAARKDHHATANFGGHGGYAAYVRDKAEYDTPKLPAWHNKVGDDAGYTNTYKMRLHEAAADHKVNTAMNYQHNPTTTNGTTMIRY